MGPGRGDSDCGGADGAGEVGPAAVLGSAGVLGTVLVGVDVERPVVVGALDVVDGVLVGVGFGVSEDRWVTVVVVTISDCVGAGRTSRYSVNVSRNRMLTRTVERRTRPLNHIIRCPPARRYQARSRR